MSAVLWIGSFLLGKSKKAAGVIGIGALLSILSLAVALFARDWFADREASRLAEARDQALIDLGECRTTSANRKAAIEEINRQAAENERAAMDAIERAERAATELNEGLSDAEQRHAEELDRLRAALEGSDCAALHAPADLDRLLRESPGPD